MNQSIEPNESNLPEDIAENTTSQETEKKPKNGNRKKKNGEIQQAETEVVEDIVEQAKQVQRVAEKIYFLSVLKRFGLAFAGILILLGTISATAFFLLFFNVIPTDLPKNLVLVIEIGLGMLSIIHILSGLALLAG